MIEILKRNYWSKSRAFLLPLTGLPKKLSYDTESYLFWDEYSIENYQLILKWKWDSHDEFIEYCRKEIFNILDKNSLLTEIFDGEEGSVFVLDMSSWASDIEAFLKGKYSKFSDEAKSLIENYHRFYDGGYKIAPEISASLEPSKKFKVYGNISAIEYVSQNYGLDLEQLIKIGELADIYDKNAETLTNFEVKIEL